MFAMHWWHHGAKYCTSQSGPLLAAAAAWDVRLSSTTAASVKKRRRSSSACAERQLPDLNWSRAARSWSKRSALCGEALLSGWKWRLSRRKAACGARGVWLRGCGCVGVGALTCGCEGVGAWAWEHWRVVARVWLRGRGSS